MTWHIIEKAGERQIVTSLVGHEGWVEVGQSEVEPPDGADWNTATGQWVVDQQLLASRDELAEVNDRQRLRQALKAARHRIATLENRQNQLIAAVQALQSRVTALEGA